MLKFIKKSVKYLIILTGIIILLPTVLYTLVQIPDVQTYLVKRITGHFSTELKSTIKVGRLEYKFFNKLSAEDVLIKDSNSDTLVYIKSFTAGIRSFGLKNNKIRLGKVVLIKPVVALITDSSGVMNLNRYLELLRKTPDASEKKSSKISIAETDIRDGRLSLINEKNKKTKPGIDFNNLKLSALNGIIEDLKIHDDTTSFDLYKIAFREAGGLRLKKMNSSVMLAKHNIFFNSTSINLDSSLLNIPKITITSDSSGAFKRFAEEVKLSILFNKSLINTSDLSYFVPAFKVENENILLSGRVSGTISELRGRNIMLSYRDRTNLDCDFDISGLPDAENAYIFIGVNKLSTNFNDISHISIKDKGKIVIPDVVKKMGVISFSGNFTGFLTDFVTYGEISTDLGNIRTDVSLRPEGSGNYKIKGLLNGKNINLGEITDNPNLFGKLTIRANVDGSANSIKKFAVNLTGNIDSVGINSYVYKNIALNGFFKDKTWDGSINIKDENIKMDFLGSFNFEKDLPEFDFTLNLPRANLYKLNFDKADSTSSLSLLLTSNFRGSNIDNLDGEIKLLNSTLHKYGNDLEMYDSSIKTNTDKRQNTLSLRTDFLDADIKGRYNFSELGTFLKRTLSGLMPSVFRMPPSKTKLTGNSFTFDINFKNTDKVNNFFRTGVLLADKSYIRGVVSPDSVLSVICRSKSLSVKKNLFSDFEFDAKIKGNSFIASLNSTSLKISDHTEFKGFNIKLDTKPDNFVFSIDWNNKDKILNLGNFTARGMIENNPKGKGNPILAVTIDSSDIYLQDNLWKIKRSSVLIDTSSFKINKFQIANQDHFYMIDGSVSEDPADTLHLNFRGIDISPITYLVNQKNQDDPNKVVIDFKGSVDGNILLTNVYRNLLAEGNLKISGLTILGSPFGNFFINSAFDIGKKVVNISANNDLAGSKTIDITGFYDPTLKKIKLAAQARKLSMDALNPLLKLFASGISGTASGNVVLTGHAGNIELNGAIMAENANMKIDYLQTKYKLNDSVHFDKEGIQFRNVRLTDEKGNAGILSGTVFHKSFKNFTADVAVNMNSSSCQVLNTKPKDNDMYYGTAYASGVCKIKSGPSSLTFDISAKTGKNTRFYIPLTKGLSVADNSFVTFVDSKSTKTKLPAVEAPPVDSKKVGMDVNFDLEVTPEAEVQLIFDSKVGDVMRGKGSGNLNVSLNKKGDFRIVGDYIVEDGDYLFTLGNILNKSFTVENGGRIIFKGDLDDAEIDMKAIYKLKASLYEILGEGGSNERIPVECQLNLSGKLFNPVVGFNIYLPVADEETRTYLKNALSTEEELSRQFLYLLIMNSFYAEPSKSSTTASGGSQTTPTGTSAMAVTTTEMLSNQLSNWLSQISKDFDIGFAYRPGSGNKDINPQELQVALSTQLLNNKVTINGNFDVRGNGNSSTGTTSSSSNPITGDFDAEYKITDKIRFKVFNRFNNPYTGKGVGIPYTQGIGIFFKQDFDKFSDLFKRKTKSEMKKEDEPAVKKDSLPKGK